MDDKGCYNHNSNNFEFHKANNTNKKILGSRSKPTPSKWDDAQKWLAGISAGREHAHGKNKPRNSNADDRRLLNSASQRARESTSSVDVGFYEDVALAISGNVQHDEGETKKVDCGGSELPIKSLCLRDAGTEMTPIASQDPSRSGTPIRATTPALTSPMDSRNSSPGRCQHQGSESYQMGHGWAGRVEGNLDGRIVAARNIATQVKVASSLETRALAWDEAERAKYMAR